MAETDVAVPQTTSPHARTVVALGLGARICLLVGAVLLVVAGYLFWGPIGHNVSGGFPADCGSAAHPPSDRLGKAVCGTANDVRRAEALAALIAAVVVAGGGVLAFGVTRTAAKPRQHTTDT